MASRSFVAQHGMSSHTPAVQHLIRTAVGALVTGGRRRKKKMSSRLSAKTAKRSRRRLSRVRSRSGKRARRGAAARLVKGSAAAKRYMAKIRRMRKK